MMERVEYAQHGLTAWIALYTAVSNAAALRERIINAATAPGPEWDSERSALNLAFIDARLITSLLHLKTAIYQAILADNHGSLRTKTIHSEILWALSPNNNITDALRRYGVSDTTLSLFVVRIDSPELVDVECIMSDPVCGTSAPLSTLSAITDWAAIRKYYKLNNEPAIKNAASNAERERLVIDKIVVSSVAMKSVM